MHACKNGHDKLATLLMSKGAAIEGRQKSGMTPLMAACHWGHAELARTLLANKADIGKKDAEGWTPLIWACVRGHAEVVNLLIANKADIDVQGRRRLDAAAMGCRWRTSDGGGVLAAGGSPSGREGSGWTDRGGACGRKRVLRHRGNAPARASCRAARRQGPDTAHARLLFRQRCNGAKADRRRYRCRQQGRGRHDGLDARLRRRPCRGGDASPRQGAAIDSCNKFNTDALMLACWKGHVELVKPCSTMALRSTPRAIAARRR